jgi:hypothetical protein
MGVAVLLQYKDFFVKHWLFNNKRKETFMTKRLFDNCESSAPVFLFFIVFLLSAINCPLTTAFASTPGKDTLVNYDTAWTYVLDGGKTKLGSPIADALFDVKYLANGVCVCVGQSGDTSTTTNQIICIKINGVGKPIWSKLLKYKESQAAHAIAIRKNGDFIIGGHRVGGPLLMKTDSLGNVKWTTWYMDSVLLRPYLNGNCVINYLKETSRGIIICAAGDEYPNNNGLTMHNYAALLQFDSLGRSPYIPGEACYVTEFKGETGYNINGFCIDETSGKNYVLAGNQNVYYTDTIGNPIWRKAYTFWLDGVGTVTNNVYRAKVLRDNTLMVAGQAYEGNCWKTYQHLYYDAWWTPVDYASGSNKTKDTTGLQGGDDILYDFNQLKNGNLVFIGTRHNVTTDIGGIWVFVTDSTGKKYLWGKQQQVVYKNDAANGRSATGYSVCATDDGGFTVVGDLNLDDSSGRRNGLVAHFVPKPLSTVLSQSLKMQIPFKNVTIRQLATKLVVQTNMSIGNGYEASLFDISGKRIFKQKGMKTVTFDMAGLSKGTYIVRMKSGERAESGKVIVN